MSGQDARRVPPHRGRLALCACLLLASGCSATDPLGAAGIAFQAPADWRPVDPATWPVPGTPVAAWSVPGGGSLVIYRALPAPGLDAPSLTRGLVARLENLPGLRLVRSGTAPVGGLDAARVELVAPGTGEALAPTGTGVPWLKKGQRPESTRRVLWTIPRAADTLAFVFHAPENLGDGPGSQLDAALRAAKIDPGRLASSSY